MTGNGGAAAAAPSGAVRLLDVWHKAECWLAVACFSFIAVILVLDVLGREALAPLLQLLSIDAGPTGIFGAQRYSLFALVIGSFAGIGIATATGSHLVPRVAFGWVPAHWGPAMDRLADVLTGLILLAVTYFGFVFVESTHAAQLRTPVIDWLLWPFQLAIPLGFLSAALRYLVFAVWPSLRPKPPEFQE